MESQNRITAISPTAKWYIHYEKLGNKIALFVRENKMKDGYTSPFVFLGTASYVQHSGSKPVSFVWRLHEPLPASIIPEAKKCVL